MFLDCCLDVEWLTDDMFVSCGVDMVIHVMKLGSDNPLETLRFIDYPSQVFLSDSCVVAM